MILNKGMPNEDDIKVAENEAELLDRYLNERYSEDQTFENWQKGVPPLVFKYKNVDTATDLVRLIDIFKNNRVYLARLSELNDPFEGNNVDYLGEEAKVYEKRVNNCRVLSLSRDCFSATLWAHYAGECKGICLGYNTFDTFSAAEKVRYTETVDKKQWWSIDKEEALRKNVLYKNEEWKYESEYRLLRTLDKECKKEEREEQKYLKYNPSELVMVIFGEKMDEDTKKTVKALIPTSVSIFDIKADKGRSRYYLTEFGASDPIAYSSVELYNYCFRKQ